MSDQPPIVQKLASASEGLLMPSENDYPFHPFFFEAKAGGALEPKMLAEELKLESKEPVEERALDEFFEDPATEEDWMEDEEKASAKKFAALRDLVKQELKDSTVYVFGERKLDAVIVGRVEKGFAGLTTQIVET